MKTQTTTWGELTVEEVKQAIREFVDNTASFEIIDQTKIEVEITESGATFKYVKEAR